MMKRSQVAAFKCCKSSKHNWTSNDGMKGTVFGFGQWILGFVAAIFVDEYALKNDSERNALDRTAVLELMQSMDTLLWCRYCRDSFAQFNRDMPPLESQEVSEWLFAIKELVNRKLNKLSFPPEFTKPFYIDQETEYWKVGQVSPQFLVSMFTNLYLTALNYPVEFSLDEPRHVKHQSAVARLFGVMHRCIPGVARTCKDSFRQALSECITLWLPYFEQHSDGKLLHFTSRHALFTFVFQLEKTWKRIYEEIEDLEPGHQSSMFGDTCLKVHQYFEGAYRASQH